MRSTVVVSLRAKGLQGLSWQTWLDWRGHLISSALAVSDVFVSAFTTLVCLSYTSWLSILVTILVMVTDTTTKQKADSSAFLPLFAAVLLPMLLTLKTVLSRRDRALRSLARFKVAFTALHLQAQALTPHTADPLNAGTATDTAQTLLPPHAAPHCMVTDDMSKGGVEAAAAGVVSVLQLLLDDLHKYLAHRRPYARHFKLPYKADAQTSGSVLRLSRDIGILSRRVHRSLRETLIRVGGLCEQLPGSYRMGPSQPHPRQATPGAGTPAGTSPLVPVPQPPSAPAPMPAADTISGTAPDTLQALPGSSDSILEQHLLHQWEAVCRGLANVSQVQAVCTYLQQQAVVLHGCVEELVVTKEYRTPMLLRAMLRWYVVVILPVFLGWYWQVLSRAVNQSVSGVLAVLFQVAVLVVLDTVVSLEDPFDEQALDGISLYELVDSLACLTANDPEDLQSLGSGGDSSAAATAGTLGGADVRTQRGRVGSLQHKAASPPMPPPPHPMNQAWAQTVGFARV